MCYTKQAMAVLIASSFLYAGLASAQATQGTQATQPQKPSPTPAAPVAGVTPLGVTVSEMDLVVAGWSVKNDILRKSVINDQKQKIGTVTDLIISPHPDAKIAPSFAIIGVGGFLGLARHDVAIPMEQIQLQGRQLVLPNATKEALKALPPFIYKRK